MAETSDKWLIWSIEHEAWWKQDADGYTDKANYGRLR